MDHFIFFVFLAFIVFSNAHLIARKKRPVLKEKRPLRIRPKSGRMKHPLLVMERRQSLRKVRTAVPSKKALRS
ncbi:hypothetical protein M5E89_05345 [Acidaminococcus intestini]|nr:hypothetical protein M5E89_05345 [Acidaminococcus intestini]